MPTLNDYIVTLKTLSDTIGKKLVDEGKNRCDYFWLCCEVMAGVESLEKAESVSDRRLITTKMMFDVTKLINYQTDEDDDDGYSSSNKSRSVLQDKVVARIISLLIIKVAECE